MVKCSVMGCHNNSNVKHPGISFHGFPTNIKLRLSWLNAINRPEFKPSKASKVCSNHFNENDINYTLNRPRLKDDACPFIHIPNLPPGQHAKQLLQEVNLNQIKSETNYCDVSQSKIQDNIVLSSTSQSKTPTAQLDNSNLNLFPGMNYDDVPQTTVQDKSLGICKTAESVEQNIIRKLRTQNLILRKKIKMLNQKARRQKKKIISLKSLYNDLIDNQIIGHDDSSSSSSPQPADVH